MEILADAGLLPEGLAAMEPGAELLALATSVDLDRLPGEQFEGHRPTAGDAGAPR